jgi:hypothetical protein
MNIRTISVAILGVGLSMALSPAAEAKGKHLFILSGQSNMRQPLPDSFRSCVEAVLGPDNVFVVTEASPSQPIKQWYKNWKPPKGMADEKPETKGNIYDKLLAKVQRTVKETPLKSVTYIWMQGEADAKAGWGSVYEASFMGVLDQIKNDLKIDEINFVVGRINDFWTDPEQFPDGKLVREIQVNLGEKNPNGAWINTDDLNYGINPWGGFSLDDGHFPPPGYRIMGQRFAKAACQLIDPDMKLDDTIFEEVFFDEASDIESHVAIGKKVTASIQPAKGSLDSLTNGNLDPQDSKGGAWVGFAPSEEPIELIVDLGEVMQVELAGVHLLFSPEAKAEFPKRITISTSEDGESFNVNGSRYNSLHLYHGTREALDQLEAPATPLLLVTEQKHRKAPEGVQARYIKIEIQSPQHGFYLNEIIVNPS